jgi:hypothetical protein
MRLRSPTGACEVARAGVSLELDGELSQLEARMLASHLDRCADCREYATSVRAFTTEIRAAPLESPSHPIVVSRARRSVFGRVQMAAASAAAVLVAGIASQLASFEEPAPARAPEGLGVAQFQTRIDLEREIDIIEQVRTRTAVFPGAFTL